MIIELNKNQLILISLALLSLLLLIYIYLYKKSIKRAEKRFNNRKKELKKSIKKEYLAKFKEWKEETEKEIREDALQRSNYSLNGQIAENLAPLTKNFDHDLKNLRYLGSPVDYIAFDNYGKEKETEIYFIEVKSGDSRLSNNQRELKNVVKKKKVYWETIRIE